MQNIQHHHQDYLRSGLWKALILITTLIMGGILGYYFFFDYSLIDAFYMTVITVGTVGFGEVLPLDAIGKIFTAILILLSIFIFAYAVTTISAYLVSINSILDYKKRKMQQKINSLKNHVVICGYGRNGKQASIKLKSYKRDFVVVEQNKEIIEILMEEGIPNLEGNATEDEILMKAGILNASFLITSLPSDSDNVFITLTAKQLNPKLTIYSRASEESSLKKLKIAGADHVIMPDKIGGDHMASLIVAPDLIEFLDNLSSSTEGSMNIQEIMLTNLPQIKTIQDLKIRENTGCTVIGYKTKNGDYIVNPDINFNVQTEGRIIVLGNFDQIQKLNKVFALK